MSDDFFGTPVAMLVYNRPDKTARVLERVAALRPRQLLVVADGPNPAKPADAEKTRQTRALFDALPWECDVRRNFSEANLGCRKRVSSGIDWVFAEVEEAIILEDDTLPVPSFFRFCAEMLERYRHDERVGMISGDNFQFGRKRGPYSYFFSFRTHIWGWATWRRAWRHYDADMKLWPEVRASGLLIDLLQSESAAAKWTHELDLVHQGKLDTWDYQWMLTNWCRHQLSVMPEVNLIANIGFDSSATHTVHRGPHSNLPVGEMEFPLSHPPHMLHDFEADAWTGLVHGEMPEEGILRRERHRISAGKAPESAAALIEEAATQLQEYKVDEALFLLTRAHAHREKVRNLNRLRALCFFHYGNHQAALQALQEELAFFPDNAAAVDLHTRLRTGKGKPFLDGDPFAPLQPETLLWIRIDNLGDNVWASGQLPALKALYPKTKITVLCDQSFQDIYKGNPHVSSLIAIDRSQTQENAAYREALLQFLRDQHFDMVLYGAYSRTPLGDVLALTLGVRRTVGFDGDCSNIDPAAKAKHNSHYLTLARPSKALAPETVRHREFLAALGAREDLYNPALFLKPEDFGAARALFEEHGLVPEKTVALAVGVSSTGGVKHYSRYAEAIAPVCREHGLRIAFVGTASDARFIAENRPAVADISFDLSGKTPIRTLAAFLKQARIVAGADSGIINLARVQGIPSVFLLGGGHFGRFAPFLPNDAVACLPLACYGCNWVCRYERIHCVRDVAPEVFREAFRRTLEDIGARPRLFMEAAESFVPQPGGPLWQDPSSKLEGLDVEYIEVKISGG